MISSHILSELERIIDQVVLLDHGQVILATSMAHLHEIGANYLSLKTTDDLRCARILNENHIRATQTSLSVHVPILMKQNLNKLFGILINNHVQILDVQHLQEDLEDSVVTLLTNQGGYKK